MCICNCFLCYIDKIVVLPYHYSCWATHFKPTTRPLSPSLTCAHRHIFHKVKVTNSKNAYTILPTCAQHILTLTCRAESDYNCLFSPHVRVRMYLLLFLMWKEVFITSPNVSPPFLLLSGKYEISWLWVLPMIGQNLWVLKFHNKIW